MPSTKPFKLRREDIKPLVRRMGGCLATDEITVLGRLVGYMYREEPDHNGDSGWRFCSGRESQEYLDDAANTTAFEVNTIANYDPAIIPYLESPLGTELERVDGTSEFRNVSRARTD